MICALVSVTEFSVISVDVEPVQADNIAIINSADKKQIMAFFIKTLLFIFIIQLNNSRLCVILKLKAVR